MNLKRVLSVILVFAIALSLCPTVAFAASPKFETEDIDSETCMLTKYTGNDTKLTIPAVINGKQVVEIDDSAFYLCDNLQSVVIPEGVEVLHLGAFRECKNLSKISFPSTVRSMSWDSFDYCPKIGDWDKTTNEWYFNNWLGHLDYETSYKGTYKVKDGTVGIMDYVFKGRVELTDIEFADSVIALGEEACFRCYGLTSVKLPRNLKYISEGAFNTCKYMKSIYIPKSVTYIGSWAFGYCDALTDVYYEGTEEEWEAIEIDWSHSIWDDGDNSDLYRAKKHFNSYTPSSSSSSNKPSKVSKVKITVKSDRVTLRWKGSQQADGYIVEQYKGGKWKRVAKTTKLSYTVKQLKAGTKYKFRIKAYNKAGAKMYYSKYVTFSVTTKKRN